MSGVVVAQTMRSISSMVRPAFSIARRPAAAARSEVFSPSAADVSFARAVVAAFALPENQGKGAIRVEGRMAELLHMKQAERLIAVADAISAADAAS